MSTNTTPEWGTARSSGISYQELLATDTHPVPDVLRIESPRYEGAQDFSKDRYTTRDYHNAEKRDLWSRVWQYACSEDEIREVGDYYLYEIAGAGYIVIRAKDGGIRAYPNACLHRGRQLKDDDGHCSDLRCAFHGFTWTIDGDLHDIPSPWDFPQVKAEEFKLPQAKTGVWAGFVFINPDEDAEPLADFVGELDDHLAAWDLERRCKQAHVAMVVQANWKIVQEAFCEASLSEPNSQVDIWDNFARVITPGGTPPSTSDEPITIDEQSSMRAIGAQGNRERWGNVVGDIVDTMSDAEMVDGIGYTLFPNFHPAGAFNRIVYRFRPNGDDHRSSIMECISLGPYGAEEAKPPPCKVHWLEDGETFNDAPELGMLGPVLDQDLFNMTQVQRGLEQSHKPGVTFSLYQESKLRWLHNTLTKWVDA